MDCYVVVVARFWQVLPPFQNRSPGGGQCPASYACSAGAAMARKNPTRGRGGLLASPRSRRLLRDRGVVKIEASNIHDSGRLASSLPGLCMLLCIRLLAHIWICFMETLFSLMETNLRLWKQKLQAISINSVGRMFNSVSSPEYCQFTLMEAKFMFRFLGNPL